MATSPADTSLYRLTFREGRHQWTFAFTIRDIPAVLDRIRALEADADAPFDPALALRIAGHVERVRLDALSPQSASDPADGPCRGKRDSVSVREHPSPPANES